MCPFYRHVNHLNFPTGGECLHDVILGHIASEPPNMHWGGFRGSAPPFPFFFHLFWAVWIGAWNAACCHVCAKKDSERRKSCWSWSCGKCWDFSDRLDTEEEPEPALVLESGLAVELDQDLVPLLPLEALGLCRVLSRPRSFSLDCLAAPVSLEPSLNFSLLTRQGNDP